MGRQRGKILKLVPGHAANCSSGMWQIPYVVCAIGSVVVHFLNVLVGCIVLCCKRKEPAPRGRRIRTLGRDWLFWLFLGMFVVITAVAFCLPLFSEHVTWFKFKQAASLLPVFAIPAGLGILTLLVCRLLRLFRAPRWLAWLSPLIFILPFLIPYLYVILSQARNR